MADFVADFDHEDHLAKLKQAADVLYSAGHFALAGVVSRAAALHRDARSRYYHAKAAQRELKRLERYLRGATTLLREHVMKPDAPWIEPPGQLYPREDNE